VTQCVQPVTLLGERADQVLPLEQALPQLLVDRRGWCPRLRLQGGCQLGQRLGVDGVGLGALEERLGELMRLGGIDHTHRVPRVVEMQGEGHPVGVRRFQHHQ